MILYEKVLPNRLLKVLIENEKDDDTIINEFINEIGFKDKSKDVIEVSLIRMKELLEDKLDNDLLDVLIDLIHSACTELDSMEDESKDQLVQIINKMNDKETLKESKIAFLMGAISLPVIASLGILFVAGGLATLAYVKGSEWNKKRKELKGKDIKDVKPKDFKTLAKDKIENIKNDYKNKIESIKNNAKSKWNDVKKKGIEKLLKAGNITSKDLEDSENIEKDIKKDTIDKIEPKKDIKKSNSKEVKKDTNKKDTSKTISKKKDDKKVVNKNTKKEIPKKKSEPKKDDKPKDKMKPNDFYKKYGKCPKGYTYDKKKKACVKVK